MSAAWPDDPALARIASIHAPSADDGDRYRHTVVATEDDRVVGGGTILGSALHPTRLFVVVIVGGSHRRRGVGTLLLERLVELGDARPLIARVREHDDPGLAFLGAHGFELLMRNRVGVVDPQDRRVRAWEAGALRTGITLAPSDRAREEVARLHEAAYRREHASWAPVATRPPEE